jgi:glycosyltransferase involved in cell wall biosynthesis
MSTSPLVSVIIATYNRSRVLAHAIESVRRSTLEDYELIVVGDHCTDDTADVVGSFADERIRYVNLPRNAGEQSGPHNEGVRLARGRYLAFLNHDDMYFPDHLSSAVAFRERTGADLVWVPLLVALPSSEADLAAGRWQFRLSGVPIGDEYDPRVFVFASAWLLTRDLAASVGPWRPARETFVSSSQDWLFRAWRSGSRLQFLPHATVLAVPGGARAGSYLAAASPEHEHLASEMRTNPRFRDRALEIAAIAGEREANRHRFGHRWFEVVRGLLFRPVGAAAVALGVHPQAPYFAVRYGRRGNLVSAIRRRTGLDRLG